ncbi:hypothetical protein Tsubulata_046640 [Turnera subulata]|uniref:F-box domain-containing protein n=1 Tax=Turnera subulata TaxID=218843 RepID=A0A9Q0G480_9ROSI|nr:hypothetical protein Tsubulata_046640 [Turnera subulata]
MGVRQSTEKSKQAMLGAMDTLSEDLLMEILVQLHTPKEVILCKLVCKRWYTLISSPCFIRHFITYHNQHSTVNDNALRECEWSSSFVFLSQSPPYDEKGEYIVNGAAYRYWVLCITEKESHMLQIRVYSSETKKWKAYNSTGKECEISSKVVSCNGKLHWYNGMDMIVASDPRLCTSTDEYETTSPGEVVPVPDLEGGLLHVRFQGRCGGFLRLILERDCVDQVLGAWFVWELKDFKTSEWSLEHKVLLPEPHREDVALQSILPLAFHPTNGNSVYLSGLCTVGTLILCCNMEEGKLEAIGSIGVGYNYGPDIFPVVRRWWPTVVSRLNI